MKITTKTLNEEISAYIKIKLIDDHAEHWSDREDIAIFNIARYFTKYLLEDQETGHTIKGILFVDIYGTQTFIPHEKIRKISIITNTKLEDYGKEEEGKK